MTCHQRQTPTLSVSGQILSFVVWLPHQLPSGKLTLGWPLVISQCSWGLLELFFVWLLLRPVYHGVTGAGTLLHRYKVLVPRENLRQTTNRNGKKRRTLRVKGVTVEWKVRVGVEVRLVNIDVCLFFGAEAAASSLQQVSLTLPLWQKKDKDIFYLIKISSLFSAKEDFPLIRFSWILKEKWNRVNNVRELLSAHMRQ